MKVAFEDRVIGVAWRAVQQDQRRTIGRYLAARVVGNPFDVEVQPGPADLDFHSAPERSTTGTPA